MQNGQACCNVFARGRNWAGLSNANNFGPGSPNDVTSNIRAGWAAHFLMSFTYRTLLADDIEDDIFQCNFCHFIAQDIQDAWDHSKVHKALHASSNSF